MSRPRIIGAVFGAVLFPALLVPGAATATNTPGSLRDTSQQIAVRPTSGPAGSMVRIVGRGFIVGGCNEVHIFFRDGIGLSYDFGTSAILPEGTVKAPRMIPIQANEGTGSITAWTVLRDPRMHLCNLLAGSASTSFEITP